MTFISVILYIVVLSSQRTQSVLITKTVQVMSLKKTMAVYCETHIKHTNRPTFYGKAQSVLMLQQAVHIFTMWL
jgi:hypothetical protein